MQVVRRAGSPVALHRDSSLRILPPARSDVDERKSASVSAPLQAPLMRDGVVG